MNQKVDGKPDRVSSPELLTMLRLARGRLKWVTLSACWSGAAMVAETLRWLGLEPKRTVHSEDACQTDGVQPEVVRNDDWAERETLPSVAYGLVRVLDCAVLAMRYPVGDEFAIDLGAALYEGVLDKRQTLTRALQLALLRSSMSPLCIATPALFGRRAVELALEVPEANGDARGGRDVQGMAYFPPPPAYFVGRVGVMARASQALAPESGRTGVLFHGMSGAGKSACALELAYHFEDLKRFTGFVWYEGPKEGSEVAGALIQFAQNFETHLSDENLNPLFPLVHMMVEDERKFDAYLPRVRQFLERRSVLIVLDNIETLLRSDGHWTDPRWGKLVATLLVHRGDSRVVLTSRVVPVIPLVPDVAGGSSPNGQLLCLPIHALPLDEAALLARQLPNLGGMLKGRRASGGRERERYRQLVARTLEIVQGHPKLIELAEKQAADPNALESHLDRAMKDWASDSVDRSQLTAFFSEGESKLKAEEFLHALASWTNAIAATLPEVSRTLFYALCCMEVEDRESIALKEVWPKVWEGLGLAGEPPELAAIMAPLVRTGLVDERPMGEEASTRVYLIHPSVAEVGLAEAGEPIRAVVDSVLTSYWVTGLLVGKQQEARGTGWLVVKAGRSALPYLMRQQKWSEALIMLDRSLTRDPSPTKIAAILPLLGHIAEATRKAQNELLAASLLARGLQMAGRLLEAEPRLREILTRAIEREEFRIAAAVASDLIRLLRITGRTEEGLAMVQLAKDYSRRANLGALSQLAHEVQRLELLADLGKYNEVLDGFEELRPRIDALSLSSNKEEAGELWNVREHFLDLGRSVAANLEQWEQAMSLSAEIIAIRKARAAPAWELATTRYYDYGPLLRLGHHAEARDLLMACRNDFEAVNDVERLGMLFGALADLENNLGNHDQEIAHSQTALRYIYLVGNPEYCAIGHFNLAASLINGGGLIATALAHRLASAMISLQTGSGLLAKAISVLSSDLASCAPCDPSLPGDFAELCRIVEETEGVGFGELFSGLPTTRAGSGNVALRMVLDLAKHS